VSDTVRKIFWLVGRDNPARWVLLVIGAVVASGLEMLGAVLIYLLLAIIASPAGPLELPIVGDVRALAEGVDETSFLLWAAVVLGVFFLLRAGYFVFFTYVKNRLAHSAGERLSSRLADGYLRMPYAFHLRRNSSELIRNAHNSVEELAQYAFLSVIQVIAEFFLVVGLVLVMVIVAPAATGVAVLIVGSAAAVLLFTVQPRLRRLGVTAQEMRKRTLGSLQQSLHGIRDIRVLGVAPHFSRRYRADRRRLARTLYLRGTVIELPRLVIETSLVGFILLLFAASVAAGTATEELLSTLGLFAYAGLRIQPSLQKFVGGLNLIRFSESAVEHVYDDLRLVDEVDADVTEDRDLTFEEAIRLEDVSFTYEGTDRPAVHDVNLVIRPGEVIGICGPTGGGKTTLTDLIVGLLEPTEGRVTVDDVDLRDRKPAWYRKLGVVPQMVFLVDDTLRRNIALGLEDDEVDETALTRAVELAQLDDFVTQLPAGLDTVVGERGVRVSGGQRQRIAIARALYRQPEVLVFDEGTSALDNATESALIGALERLRGRHTIILVAHRLSTVRTSDRVVLIEDGRVGAVGSFERLRRVSASFRALTLNS
jgi:ATP-binding cassette, subfamily B, bacterial PglK